MIIVGIAGKARSGKDTLANGLVDGMGFERYSFADPIKEMARVGLGLTQDQLYGDSKDKVDDLYGCTPRKILQTLGTEWGRELIDGNIWIKAMERKAAESGFMVVPDIRFENEADSIRRLGGIVVHITGRDGSVESHKSESGVDVKDDDYVIENSGTLQEYEEKIIHFCVELSKVISQKLLRDDYEPVNTSIIH